MDGGLTTDRLKQVTWLLEQWSLGDKDALHQATELVYADLRRIALAYLRRERTEHTLQPTALIHEAYLRLLRIDSVSFAGRKQFLGLAARLMRQVLVDHARQTHAGKRGGGGVKVSLEDTLSLKGEGRRLEDFLILDEALTRLAGYSPRKSQIIELRYFAGLDLAEIAEVLGVSVPTVSREQRMAEAWLGDAINGNPV